MITPKSQLFVAPEPRYFDAHAEATLTAELARLERTTVIRHVGSAADLCLDADGFLPGGFIYTESAFKQVCTIAARGLDPLVQDLAGVNRGEGLRGDYSFTGAIELFNAVIRRRFRGRFDGKVRTRPEVQLHRESGHFRHGQGRRGGEHGPGAVP
jgi:hypothetical protein